jgi:hypothetical protein
MIYRTTDGDTLPSFIQEMTTSFSQICRPVLSQSFREKIISGRINNSRYKVASEVRSPWYLLEK